MSGYQKQQQDLDDIYSDLSDKEDDNQPPKVTDLLIPNQSAPKGNLIRMPAFFGGKTFIPPPPPPSSRPPTQVQSPDERILVKNQNSNFHQGNQGQRERKNILYLKNLPKSYNRQETLTTFFRTYGNIKSIKTNEQSNSAFVRFQKEQDVYKFINSKPLILNRSYIMYETNDDYVVPSEKIVERQKQQNAAQAISSEKQLMVLKENSESILADKYRALLFLNKNKDKLAEERIEQVNRQMNKCHRIKQSQNKATNLAEMLLNFQNQYDWTLSYQVITKQSIDKKKIIAQLQKYGPISTITVKLTNLVGEEIQQPQVQQSQKQIQPIQNNQDKLGLIKIKFLGVKSSWEMFVQNHQKLSIKVDGHRLQEIYKIWFEEMMKQKKTNVQELANSGEDQQHVEKHLAQGEQQLPLEKQEIQEINAVNRQNEAAKE